MLMVAVMAASCSKQGTEGNLIPRKDIVLTKAQTEYVEEGNALAFNYFHSAYLPTSFVLSPFSLQRALGMLCNGAQGKTKEEIEKVIGYGEGRVSEVNTFLQAYAQQLQAIDPSIRFQWADALLLNPNFPLREEFVNKVSSSYLASVNNLDFFSDPAGCRKWINDWAYSHTDGMIPSLVESISQETVFLLLNAVAFKGSWTTDFRSDETFKAPFYCLDGHEVQVDMMHQSGTFRYASNENYRLICLPYGNEAFQMVVLLPLENHDLSSVTHEEWNRLLADAKEQKVPVSLPKFKIHNVSNINRTLSVMGMPAAFSEEADFSLLSPGPIRLSETLQGCSLEVSESGTTAAAATALAGKVDTANLEKAPVVFNANHSFLFAIMEKSTQGILMMGQFCGL